MQQIYHIGEAKYLLRDMQSRAALAMSAHDSARFADLKKDTVEIQSKFDKNWEGYAKATEGTEAAKNNDAIQQNWKAFYASMIHVMDLAESGNMAEAESYYGKAGSDATTDLREILEKQLLTPSRIPESLYQQIQAVCRRWHGDDLILTCRFGPVGSCWDLDHQSHHPSAANHDGGLPASGRWRFPPHTERT